MPRKASAVNWSRLPDRDKRRLLHQICRWFVDDKMTHHEIAGKIQGWVKENSPTYYDPKGVVSTQFVGRRITEACQEYGFVKVGRLDEVMLGQRIINALHPLLESIPLVIAPDRNELLRYLWLDLDELLIERMEQLDREDPFVIGLSGGQTLNDLANAAPNISGLSWHDAIPMRMRSNVIVCSMTSGGTRTNIAALSDTVAARIAAFLGTQARGLLGPAWFVDRAALAAFKNDPDVQKHIQLVHSADVIITSIGYLGDDKALMRQLLDQANVPEFIARHPNLSDILYNCYNGLTGDLIPLPDKVADHLFSTIDLPKLGAKVKGGSRCIVLASGEEKGRHALPGILRRRIASHVYLDRSCAEGLIEALGP